MKLCEKALNYDGSVCSELLERTADIEEEAYELLAQLSEEDMPEN